MDMAKLDAACSALESLSSRADAMQARLDDYVKTSPPPTVDKVRGDASMYGPDYTNYRGYAIEKNHRDGKFYITRKGDPVGKAATMKEAKEIVEDRHVGVDKARGDDALDTTQKRMLHVASQLKAGKFAHNGDKITAGDRKALEREMRSVMSMGYWDRDYAKWWKTTGYAGLI